VETSRLEYAQRVNRVIDHIRAHLAEDLSLERLARVAAFSPFHFHRIFRAITGETLSAFVQRLRLERAALALVHRRDDSVLTVALDHGFASAATFARAFRGHFGMSATAWRAGGARHWSKPGQATHTRADAKGTRAAADRKLGKANRKPGKAARGEQRHGGSRPSRKETTMNVAVKELPRYRVAYMRHVGPYGAQGIPELWQRFRAWGERRGLGGPGAIKLGIGHDDPEVTPPEKCRYDACLVVPESFVADKWVNIGEVPGGRYAVTEFVGSPHTIRDAWETLYRAWLPGSGYQPDDRPCVEIYRGDPEVGGHPGTFRCELAMPVRPL